MKYRFRNRRIYASGYDWSEYFNPSILWRESGFKVEHLRRWFLRWVFK